MCALQFPCKVYRLAVEVVYLLLRADVLVGFLNFHLDRLCILGHLLMNTVNLHDLADNHVKVCLITFNKVLELSYLNGIVLTVDGVLLCLLQASNLLLGITDGICIFIGFLPQIVVFLSFL